MNCTFGESDKKAEMVEFKAPKNVDNDSNSHLQSVANTEVEEKEVEVENTDHDIPEMEESDISIKYDLVKLANARKRDTLPECSGVFSKFVDQVTVSDLSCSTLEDTTEHDMDVSEQLLLDYLKRQDLKHLKISLRCSGWTESHSIRQLLWHNLCIHLHKADDIDIYSEYADDIFSKGDDTADPPVRLPRFVDMDHISSYHLTQEGIVHAKRVLCVLEHSCPDIVCSPLLFSMVSLFLHYMDTSQCYNCIYALLRHKDGAFISTTKVSFEASKLVIRDLAKKYSKAGYVHLVRNCGNIDTLFDTWVWWIFEDLPFFYLLRILDCYLLEGVKVFYRVVLAIITLYSKCHDRRSLTSSCNILKSLKDFCKNMPVKADKLLKAGFSIRGFSRKNIHSLQVKHEMYIKSTKRIPDHNDQQNANRLPLSRSFSGPIVLQNLGCNTLTMDMLYTVWTWLPIRYAVSQPELLYTSEEHGTSLVTLYQRVESYQPTVIVIKTTRDEIFGAFCATYWRDRRQGGRNLSYFGTGETFIFTLQPEKWKYEWVGLKQDNIPNTAHMFQAGDRNILTIGGGHGEAIYLDENLQHCRSERCDTFNNTPLTMHEDFQCKVVEVYGFQ